ncbi:MAG: methyltransferase domain-containing protein [Verrucomicrobiota bacterium]
MPSIDPPSTHPAFWNPRYEAGTTPWDFGGVPPVLSRYLAAHPGHGARVLVPGCGSGYEVAAFASAGYRVTAIDFSPPAVAKARANLSPALAERVVEGDFFTYDFADAPFDLVYERTFLCSMPPAQWPQLIARTAALLAPGGILAGLYFFGDKTDGPPFGLAADEPAQLFAGDFTLVDDRPIPPAESLPLFVNRERWQERRRNISH